MPRSTSTSTAPRHRLLTLGLFAGALVITSQAAGETFLFRDRARGQAQGKVLVEFEDLLFVTIDGEPAQFLARAELKAIVDAAGQRHERPALGTFGRVGGPAPMAALTDVEGEATLVRKDARETQLTSGASPRFLRGGEALTTSDAGLLRWVFPSGAVVKQAPETQVTLPASAVREEITLDRGEVFVQARHRPLELVLAAPIVARLGAGGQASFRRKDATSHLQQHVGQTTVTWPSANFTLEAGLGAELVQLGPGRWRVTADPANPGPLDLQVGGEKTALGPGETRVVGHAGKPAPGEVWRLLRSNGDLLLRRGPSGTFALVQKAQRDRLLLGAGDALRTGPVATATLIRADGASIQLESATRLDVASVLALARGKVTVDALETPVRIEGPGGDAVLRLCVTTLEREASGVVGAVAGAEPQTLPRPTSLRVSSLTGKPQFPLAPYAAVQLTPKALALLSRSKADTRLEVEAGRTVVVSQAPPGGVDPGFRVEVQGEESLVLPRVKPNAAPILDLPGKRRLTFVGGTIGLDLALRPRVLGKFTTGASIELKAGLHLALAMAGTDPELRFRKGPRLRLSAPYEVLVENPTIRVSGRSGRTATCKLEGDLTVSLLEGGTHSAAALGLRAGDRLELPSDVIASLSRRPKTFRFNLGPRRLWIEHGAPPVQARQADAAGTLFLTMPETPSLGLSPSRPITVLATEGGEFVVLDKGELDLTAIDGGLETLSGPGSSSVPDIGRDRIPELLDVPPPDSPSGP